MTGAPWPASDYAHALRRAIALTRQMGSAGVREVEIATTPADCIWQDGKARLLRYREIAERRLGPVVIVHGLIGRQTMTDLEPKRSLVRRLLEGGVDLYTLDWGNPSRADRCLGFRDYAGEMLGDALDAAIEASGARRAVVFGICQGGVFGLCHAALYPERLKGLALAVTPVDFHADREDPDPSHGAFNVWARSLPPELVSRLVDDLGNLPGALTGGVFQALTPGRTSAKYTAELMEIAEDEDALETFLRMEKWLADRPDHPGAAAKEWLVSLYGENRLVEGRFEIGGRKVDLGTIACPVLNIVAKRDHIIPPPCSKALRRHLRNAPYRELEVDTGHVGVFVSRAAREVVPATVIDWLGGLG